MSTFDDLTRRLAPADDELLSVEFDLPHPDEDLEVRAEAERERYDEQILAALVAPSF
jgi:hypothetical protein